MKLVACTLVAFTVILEVGCENSLTSTAGSSTPANQDTLTFQVTPGVALTLSGMRDTYSLQDTVSWCLKLKNYGDATPFPLYFYGSPPYRIRIAQVGVADPVFFAPTAIGYAEWADTLSTGDSLIYPASWHQTTWDPVHLNWTTLLAYPGLYKFSITLGGNPKVNGEPIKYFQIVEGGNPLCAWLRIDYASTDSLKADFIVRNRGKAAVPLETNAPQPMTVDFLRSSTTVLSLGAMLPPDIGTINGSTDAVVFSFRASKTDSAFIPLKGSFSMRFTLHLKTQDLIASGLRFLP